MAKSQAFESEHRRVLEHGNQALTRNTLGGRQPLEILEELLPNLKQLVGGLSENILRLPQRRGKWSILEVLQHLADTEMVYGYRIRMILIENKPELQSTDLEAWARTLDYNSMRPTDAIEQLRVLRNANLRLFRSLSKEQLAREGVDSEQGATSLETLIIMLAIHDETHLHQITRIKHSVRR